MNKLFFIFFKISAGKASNDHSSLIVPEQNSLQGHSRSNLIDGSGVSYDNLGKDSRFPPLKDICDPGGFLQESAGFVVFIADE